MVSTLIDRLPLELVRELVLLLPFDDQRSCLRTSRLFYHVALRVLFATIKIYFGDWDALGLVSVKVDKLPYYMIEDRDKRSHDILNHIARNPTFAAACRRLIVYAYAQVDGAAERSNCTSTLHHHPD